jgi:hypothetical protein
LSNVIEQSFEMSHPDHYRLFNVRYVIVPAGLEPAGKVKRIARRGRHVLWETDARGYLDVVDTIAADEADNVGPFEADRYNLGTRMEGFLSSRLARQRLYPTVAFAGRPAATPTTSRARRPRGSPGRITEESDRLADGEASGVVVARRRAVVILRATFHPRWRVSVDGKPEDAEMIAPSFVGVKVPPGRHRVEFRYERFGQYPLLFAFGVLALLAIAFSSRVARAIRQGTRGEKLQNGGPLHR